MRDRLRQVSAPSLPGLALWSVVASTVVDCSDTAVSVIEDFRDDIPANFQFASHHGGGGAAKVMSRHAGSRSKVNA